MRFKCSGEKFLAETALRPAFGAEPPLLGDDIALFVEFAENGMEEALRLEERPQLEAIRRQRIEVDSLVGIREGVDADAARLIEDSREFLRDDVLVRGFDRVFPRFFELRDFRSEEHTSELQSRGHLVCRLLLEK